MVSALNLLLVVVLMLNLFALGNSRLRAIIRIVGVQGALIGIMPLLVHKSIGPGVLSVSLATIMLKGFVIPFMLMHALREAQIKREVEPLIGYLPSILLGALATGLAMVFAAQLPLAAGHKALLVVPASLATVLVGFILLITRYKAITQVIGYLVLENGIFIFGLLLIEAMPLVVEMGVLLDLFVGIFVICIIVNHINSAFSSLDTRRLIALKE
ncbi:hydrogenase [Candidatus Sumerlaeota bacterium]|nr:hydrogenase [Candidatus Sumerlaeota bacterium]